MVGALSPAPGGEAGALVGDALGGRQRRDGGRGGRASYWDGAIVDQAVAAPLALWGWGREELLTSAVGGCKVWEVRIEDGSIDGEPAVGFERLYLALELIVGDAHWAG